MNIFRILQALLLCCVLCASLAAQQTARDPQGLLILSQCVNAAGGSAAVSGIQDFTGTGTIVFDWAGQPTTGAVSIYGKGLSKFRMDANMPSGSQTFIVNQYAGSLTTPDRSKTMLPFYSVMTSGSLTVPVQRLAGALNDSLTGVFYLGKVTWHDSETYLVHVVPHLDPALDLGVTLSGLGEFDLYIDQTSFQLLGLTEKVWWGNDFSQSYTHELIFSNYTTMNGLSVPFAITERFGGQQTWSITLSSLTFNSGLSDTLFAL